MDEIKANIDISIRLNTSKNNIQINSKVSGNSNINFQDILINLGENSQKTLAPNSTQNKITLSLQSQANVKEFSQEINNSNINQDKNASISVKLNSSNQNQTPLFSEYTPQKPIDVQDLNLNKNTQNFETLKGDKLDVAKVKKYKILQKNKSKINLVNIKIVEINEKSSGIKKEENELINPSQINRRNNEPIDKKQENSNDKNDDEQKNRKQEYYQEDEISSQDLIKILESYGMDLPDFIKNEKKIHDDETWIKNLISGSIKENINDNDADKLTKFLVNKNIDKIPEKDVNVFTKLVNDIFKHKIIKLEPQILSRFEKNSTEFIIKNFPNIIYSGALKKYFYSEDKKIKDSKVKVFMRLLNNQKENDTGNLEKEDLKNSFEDFNDKELENTEHIIDADYSKLSQNDLYKSLNKIKEKGISFGSFIDNVHELIIEFHENKSKEKIKQLVKIVTDYRKYNFINGNDTHSLSLMIVKKVLTNQKLDQNKLVNIFSKIIQGENIDPVYLNIINQSLDKNILAYLPNTINSSVYFYLKDAPFYKNEFSDNSEDFFRFFIKIKINNKLPESITLNLYDIDHSEDIEIPVSKNEIGILNNGTYKLKSILLEGNEINFERMDKDFVLDFSVDKKIDIFYFGTLEIKGNNNFFKIKNEYKSFIDNYKKKFPKMFKGAIIKINPKLFK